MSTVTVGFAAAAVIHLRIVLVCPSHAPLARAARNVW
jgi:hypothetical protein